MVDNIARFKIPEQAQKIMLLTETLMEHLTIPQKLVI